jgi:hypothetical protein
MQTKLKLSWLLVKILLRLITAIKEAIKHRNNLNRLNKIKVLERLKRTIISWRLVIRRSDQRIIAATLRTKAQRILPMRDKDTSQVRWD